VQLSLLLLTSAYTATRPGALVESGIAKGSGKALCYRHINLLVLPNPNPGERDVLVLEVTLVHNKGDKGQAKP
jgi:Protein of unknown function (DUF3435)